MTKVKEPAEKLSTMQTWDIVTSWPKLPENYYTLDMSWEEICSRVIKKSRSENANNNG